MHLLYVTCATKEEAMHLTRELLTRQLIRCANILPAVTSLYEWEGQMQEESEVVIIMKTSDDKLELAIKHIEAIHQYNCPCVVAIAANKGHAPFLNWVETLGK